MGIALPWDRGESNHVRGHDNYQPNAADMDGADQVNGPRFANAILTAKELLAFAAVVSQLP
jgi:hypothetical protein